MFWTTVVLIVVMGFTLVRWVREPVLRKLRSMDRGRHGFSCLGIWILFPLLLLFGSLIGLERPFAMSLLTAALFWLGIGFLNTVTTGKDDKPADPSTDPSDNPQPQATSLPPHLRKPGDWQASTIVPPPPRTAAPDKQPRADVYSDWMSQLLEDEHAVEQEQQPRAGRVRKTLEGRMVSVMSQMARKRRRAKANPAPSLAIKVEPQKASDKPRTVQATVPARLLPDPMAVLKKKVEVAPPSTGPVKLGLGITSRFGTQAPAAHPEPAKVEETQPPVEEPAVKRPGFHYEPKLIRSRLGTTEKK